MIAQIAEGIIGIALGLWGGWILANKKAKKTEKYLIEHCDLNKEDFDKEKKLDKEFWENKIKLDKERQGRANDGIRDKYKAISGESSEGERRINSEESTIRINSDDTERSSVSNNVTEQSEPNSETIELHKPDNL